MESSSAQVGGELAVEREQLRRRCERMQHRTGEDAGDRIRAVLERGHDAEVAAAAAERPEQVAIAVLAGGDDLARGEHDLGRQQVVDCHPVLAHQPRDPAPECEARNPRRGDDAAWSREPERAGGAVELADRDAGLRPDRRPHRVDVGPLHEREIDHQATLGDRSAGDVVAAAAHRDLQGLAPAEVDRVHHIRRVHAACDHGRMPVDQPVVDAPDRVVTRVPPNKHRPRQRLVEQLDGTFNRHARHGTAPLAGDASVPIDTVLSGTLPEHHGTSKSLRRR